MLNTLFWICLGLVASFATARYFKSNRVFWIALLCMLAGFMCGTIASNASVVKKNQTILYKAPIQTPACSLIGLLPLEGDGTFVETKSVGKALNFIPNTLSKLRTINSKPRTTRKTNFFYDSS